MKPKYSHTYAELTKLQNQIRVELNHLRPCGEPIREERKEKYSKRLYHQKYSQTSICQPPEERSQQQTTPTKRLFRKDSIVHLQQNKSRERRHFQKSYADRVEIGTPLTRKTSAYFKVEKRDPQQLKYEPHHTSLYGIGQNDRSVSARAKSGKKTFPSKLTKIG